MLYVPPILSSLKLMTNYDTFRTFSHRSKHFPQHFFVKVMHFSIRKRDHMDKILIMLICVCVNTETEHTGNLEFSA
jgi:hypothetical protein